jgi:5-histidylcysteine sulfoxide synthase/putative 4-mercaptohistidine N1-methyltranferase
LEYFDNTWNLTETLFAGLAKEESFYIPPYHNLRHPMIFYYLHPAVFYVNKFLVARLIEEPLNPYFESLFEAGVDEMSWDDLNKNTMEWPAVSECTEYRRKVYQVVRNVILTHPELDKDTILEEDQCWALFMGFEHSRIHLETSSVLITELPLHLVKKPAEWPDYHPSCRDPSGVKKVEAKMISVPAGRVTLGKPRDWPSFGWDNEYGAQPHEVRPFEAGRYTVTNGEFLEFVKVLGYHTERYWTTEGWAWRSFRNTKWPTFWVPSGPQGLHQYQQRVLFDVVDMVMEWPVIVNVHEARAYCAWKSEVEGITGQPYRLLTEIEHHMIRTKTECLNHEDDHAMTYGGSDIFEKAHINGQLAFASPSPVTAHPPNPKGFHDVFGNVWQWCEDFFSPLDGFQVHPFYQDFSDPCFDALHSLIQGGSFMSTGDEVSIWARFHFRRHFFQHAGFRMARNTDGEKRIDTSCAKYFENKRKKEGWRVYESEKMLMEYLDLHFGTPEDIFSLGVGPADALGFPRRCAEYTIEHAKRLGIPSKRVLDVGCAVGASTFYLATHFESAEGVDISESFINTANFLVEKGAIDTHRHVRGEIYQPWTAAVPPEIDRTRVKFHKGDACNLPLAWGKYDTIMMANLLCRVPDPQKCLDMMKELLNAGGLLVMMTPFSWLPEYTPKEKWIGATLEHPDSFQVLQDYLTDFDLVERKTLPLVIREHERKFQYILSEASVWKLRS